MLASIKEKWNFNIQMELRTNNVAKSETIIAG